MSEALNKQSCEACRADAEPVSYVELSAALETLEGWTLIQTDGVDQLQRQFSFQNFVEALAFTHKVGELAEAENHHPAITTEWGKVTVRWWTHKIKGLHQNDLICAAKTNGLYNP